MYMSIVYLMSLYYSIVYKNIVSSSINTFIYYISYRVTGLYRLGKTCYLHSLLSNNSIITQFSVQ